MEAIAAFERHLSRQGTVVLKFFLHVSKAEQKRRFLERLEEKDKQWKFSASDRGRARILGRLSARLSGGDRRHGTPQAPWFMVPADNKWFTRLIVVEAMIEALDELDLRIPKMSPGEQAALEAARRQLEAEN